MRLGWDFKYKN